MDSQASPSALASASEQELLMDFPVLLSVLA